MAKAINKKEVKDQLQTKISEVIKSLNLPELKNIGN
jgi:hypothetical protein